VSDRKGLRRVKESFKVLNSLGVVKNRSVSVTAWLFSTEYRAERSKVTAGRDVDDLGLVTDLE